MRQLAAQAVQVMHKDGMHQSLVHKVTKLGELRAVERRPGIVVHKEVTLWHRVAFLMGEPLAGIDLRGQGIPFIGLIRSRHTSVDGGLLLAIGLYHLLSPLRGRHCGCLPGLWLEQVTGHYVPPERFCRAAGILPLLCRFQGLLQAPDDFCGAFAIHCDTDQGIITAYTAQYRVFP